MGKGVPHSFNTAAFLFLPDPRQPAQGGKIQMIVVIVADQHRIDAGKILPPHPRLPASAGTDPGEWTGPLRPDRVSQDVGITMLEQYRRVVDQGHPQIIAFHARRRFRLLYVRNETGGWLGSAGEPSSAGHLASRAPAARPD